MIDLSTKNIYLIGPRASGKTTLGTRLAESLHCPFLDLDEEFRIRENRTIADLVEKEGWDAFRAKEREILADVHKTPGRVIATGGGVVLDPANRDLLIQGLTLYLQADPDTLAKRLASELLPEQRPNLTSLDLEEEIKQTLNEREPLYLRCSVANLPARPIDELVTMALKVVEMV
ncbi:shikimate kinase [Desulfovibrio inopinatus]|uniref:shikimate kinase n=1 Tax=Desulfovibrio inopinatus TaxID=102109 RepID=UPI00042909F4|nr:shikimate kinase [Desulfovibrio inopinatus]